MTADPRRLFDDPDAPELLRSDLAEVRENPGVNVDVEAGLARLSVALGEAGPAPGGAGGGAAPSATPAGSAPLAGSVKLAFIAAVGAVVAAGAWLALRPPSQPAPPASSAAVATAAPRDAPSAAVPSAAPEAPPIPSIDIDDLPQQAKTAPKPAPSAAPPLSPEERLRAEMKQLAEVRAAVSSSPARGLDLANHGHQQFKRGVFYQEREALAISALVRLGRGAEAKARARAFLTSFPKGPHAERVRKEAGLEAP